MPRILKQRFFKNLKERVGKTYCLMSGNNQVANVRVFRSNSILTDRFSVKITYVGKHRNKNSDHSFTCSSWDDVGYFAQRHFLRRSFIDHSTPEVEKPSEEKLISIKMPEPPLEDDRLSPLRYLKYGTPFWYKNVLYIKMIDSLQQCNVFRVSDGGQLNLNTEINVLPTKLVVNVVGDVP